MVAVLGVGGETFVAIIGVSWYFPHSIRFVIGHDSKTETFLFFYSITKVDGEGKG